MTAMTDERKQLITRAIGSRILVVLAETPDPASSTLRIQDYVRDGKSFIPLFTSEQALRESTGGHDLGRPVFALDRRLLVSLLGGSETLVLDSGLASELTISASELKEAFPEPPDLDGGGWAVPPTPSGSATATSATFYPMNPLEQVLLRATDDPAGRASMFSDLRHAKLFFLTAEDPGRGNPTGVEQRVLQPGEEVGFVQWDGPRGPFIPFFSSRERVGGVASRSATNISYLALEGKDAFALLAQHPQEAILNPGLPYSKTFTPSEIRRLAE